MSVLLGILTAAITTRVPRAAARRSGRRYNPLHQLTRGLTESHDLSQIVNTLERNFVKGFRLPLAIVLLERGELRVVRSSSTFDFNDTDLEAARLAVRHTRRVGRGTLDMPDARCSFIPLQTSEGVLGAIGFKSSEGGGWINAEEWPL